MGQGHDAYLESRITSAEPVELIRMLYQSCTGKVRETPRKLAAGNMLRVRSMSQRLVQS